MRTFEEILDLAADRKGGRGAVLGDISPPKTDKEIAAIPDVAWLEGMARGLMQSGLNWKVVENKWPGLKQAFHGFDVGRCAMMSEDWFDQLIADTRIIRSPPKVRAVQQNAVFIQEVAAEVGGFGRKVADWPAEDFSGLLLWMQKNGSRLGGSTAAYLLRHYGKESYILTRDVVARLVAEGVIDKAPTSQKARRDVQEAFNTWKAQSGLSLTHISRVLAQSIG